MEAEDSSFQEQLNQLVHEQIDHLLDQIRFVPDSHFMFAVPRDCPPDLLRKLYAAVKAHFAPYKSIDYVLNRYGKYWDFEALDEDEEGATLHLLLTAVQLEVSRLVEWWSSVPEKPGELGRVAAGAALLRLKTSFRSAGFLLQLGHIYEAYALQRMILEQTAWAYSIHRLPHEKVLSTSVTKSITVLNKLLPWVGSSYGMLSDYTHISPRVAREFVTPSKGDFFVTLRATNRRLEGAWWLLAMADTYAIVTELVYRDCASGLVHIHEVSSENFQPRSDRPLRRLMDEFRGILERGDEEPPA